MNRRLVTLAGVTLTSAAAVVAYALPATAGPSPATAPIPVPASDPDSVSSEIVAALQRDFKLSPEQARTRIANEAKASRTELSLRKRLGDAYGGAYLNADATTFTVTVTSAAAAVKVRATGATAKLVTRSEAALDKLKAKLDARSAAAPATIAGWHVDVYTNTVTVLARDVAAAEAFVASSGVKGDAVRVVASSEQPRPLIDVIGGNAYYIGGSRCSVGFSVNGGFVTAGHCGSTGASTTQPSGTFRGSSFPGNDYAWVQVAAGNTPRGLVNGYNGSNVTVSGSSEAAVGASVCRSGSTTGWRCGTIQAKNSSVTYPQGTVSGLTRTNACAEPGDSGGSWMSGNQAQGVTSGGSGNCSSGGTTYFQPVNEILSVYGLTLVTGGGTPPPTTPPPGGGACSSYPNVYTGSLSSGGQAYQPNGSYYQTTATRVHQGCLDASSSSVDFDLYLQKWNGSAWANVASSTSEAADESVSYTGTAGYYRWRVHAYSGSSSYTMGIRLT
jgi:streptogrisin C